jgi:hypothetical protein
LQHHWISLYTWVSRGQFSCPVLYMRFVVGSAVLHNSYLLRVSSAYYFIFLMEWDWVHLVLRPLFGLLYQPQMVGDNDFGAIGGIRIGRGGQSTRRKPAPVPLCPPQIPHHLTRARNRAAAVGSRLLTALAMARPLSTIASNYVRLSDAVLECVAICLIFGRFGLQSSARSLAMIRFLVIFLGPSRNLPA